jgi:WD40 repeat protein
MIDNSQKKEEILLSVLDFLERNGYKESFEKLKQKVGCNYFEKNKKIVEELINVNKINDLILFIDTNMKISNEEKLYYIKMLKIKQYIELVSNNCMKGKEQKDSLNYLRTEITPLLCQKLKDYELLNTLTYILFIKDKNKLRGYIENYLMSYENNIFIVEQICKRNIISLETLYDNYNKLSKDIILYENTISLTLDDNCLSPFKPNEAWFIQISKNKNFIGVGFSNANISIFNVVKDKNNEINVFLNLTFSGNEKNKKDELTDICFSNDEKYILVCLSSFKVILFDVINGSKIKEFKNIHTSEITSIINIPNSNNKFLTSSIDKKILMLDISNDDNSIIEIVKFCRTKQILFSECYNYIIIISGSKNEIICYNLSSNKIENKINTNDQIVYGNISKSDKGKYLLYSISKNKPKILLYNLLMKKVEGTFSGHSQKLMIIKCAFGGDKDEFILSGSEDYIVYVWEKGFFTQPKYRFKGHLGTVNGAEMWNNDFIISISDDKTIRIWYNQNDNVKNIKYIKSKKNNYVDKEIDIDTEFFNVMNEPLNSDAYNDNDNENDNEMQIEEENNDENEDENMEEAEDEEI